MCRLSLGERPLRVAVSAKVLFDICCCRDVYRV